MVIILLYNQLFGMFYKSLVDGPKIKNLKIDMTSSFNVTWGLLFDIQVTTLLVCEKQNLPHHKISFL